MGVRPVLVTILLLIFVLAPARSDAGVCGDFLQQVLENETEQVRGFWGNFVGKKRDEQKVLGLRDTSEYWVTITEGSAFSIDCRKDLVRSLYFPTGLILKALWDLELNGRNYTLFQAEYGLYVVIDQRAVAALGPDDLYIFADSPDAYRVCINRQGEQTDAQSCDVHHVLAEPANEGWPFVHAAFSYAHAKLDESNASWAKNGETWIADATKSRRSKPGSFFPPPRPPPSSICETRGFVFYRGGNRPRSQGGTAEFDDSVSLSICAYSDQKESRKPFVAKRLKLVTADSAVQRFGRLWGSAHFKRLNSASQILETLLNITSPVRTQKNCGVETTSSQMQTIGFAVNPSLPMWGVEGTFRKSQEDKTKIVYPAEEHYIVSSYLHEDRRFYDIWLVNWCDKESGRPTIAHKIVIYNPILTDNYMDLYFEDINKDYSEFYKKYGQPADRIRKRRLESGYIFRIEDYKGYFYWYDLLSNEFYNSDKVLEVLHIFEGHESSLINYFTHLTMAAVIQTAVEMQIPGGRP